jgi:hypothetical protein
MVRRLREALAERCDLRVERLGGPEPVAVLLVSDGSSTTFTLQFPAAEAAS